MKLATISALLAVGSCFCVSIATAATCNTTLGPISSTSTVSGNNCGNNPNFNSITYCNQVPTSSTGTDAWAIQLGANQNFTFTVTSPGTAGGTAFTPDIGLLSTACADNSPCVNENTNGTGTVTSGTISGQAAGTYYIIVTDSGGVAPGCGPYDLSFTGTLPVKLETFSVE